MIGFIEGKLFAKKPTEALVNVGGIGYKINISVNTFENLPEPGKDVMLYTYLSVKEDALDLYGFMSENEKDTFKLLISVNGIGPKLAQGILSGIRVNELQLAIGEGNISRIVAVPGVGKKTAERLIVELKDKIDKIASGDVDYSVGGSVKADAISALVSLGYSLKVAEKIVLGILDNNPGITIEDLIKDSLAKLNK